MSKSTHTEPCAHCAAVGTLGVDIFSYSIAKGVIVFLHQACERAYYAAHTPR